MAKNQKNKKSSFKLPLIHDMKVDLLSSIVWGVHAKFYQRNATPSRNGDRVHKETNAYAMLTDVGQFIETAIANIPPQDLQIHVKDTADPKSKADVFKFCAKKWSLPERTAFDEFRGLFGHLHHGPDERVRVSVTRQHLEMYCLYAFDKTFKQLEESPEQYYFWGEEIRFIQTNLTKIFEDSLRGFIKSVEEANCNCSSSQLKARASKMITRETQGICDALSKGYYFVKAQHYFDELTSLMNDSQLGFGVNIPAWNKHWTTAEGKKILAINKQQHEGFLAGGAFDYIRIFFVMGDDKGLLSEEELEIITDQLEHGVVVYVIVKEGWIKIKDNLEDFDYAVLRVDNCPMLLLTKFDESGTEGIFFIHEDRAKDQYSQSLASLLVPENACNIFKPTLADGGVQLGRSLSASEVRTLTMLLEQVYKDSKS